MQKTFFRANIFWEVSMIYAHEHITIDLSGAKKDLDCRLDEKEKTIEEFKYLKSLGVDTVVDVTNCGMGRNPRYVKDVAEASNITILQSTGFYKEPFLPTLVYEKTEEQLADYMIGEILEHIENSDVKASIIGEIGTGKGAITEMEKKVFHAACIAQKATGVPIVTHTTLGTLGMEQLSIFRNENIDISRVVLSHIDLSGDLDYMKTLLDSGVNIAFDTVGKINYQPDEMRAEWLCSLCKMGYAKQIVLSMDITRKSHLKANGGLGYSYLLEKFIPLCKEKGLSASDINQLLVETPQRIYLNNQKVQK